jgi:hypothetical protein
LRTLQAHDAKILVTLFPDLALSQLHRRSWEIGCVKRPSKP